MNVLERLDHHATEAGKPEERDQDAAPATDRWTPGNVLALQRSGAGNHAISAAILARSSKRTGGMFDSLSDNTKVRNKALNAASEGGKPKPSTTVRTPKPTKVVVKKPTSFAEMQTQMKPKTPVTTPKQTPVKAAQPPVKIRTGPEGEVDRLINDSKSQQQRVKDKRDQVQDIPENEKLRKDMTAYVKWKPENQRNVKKTDDAIEFLKDRISEAQKLIERATPKEPVETETAEQAAVRRFEVIRQYIVNGMQTMPWTGQATGGVFDFELAADDHEMHRRVLEHFGRNQNKIQDREWPGKQPGETAYYWVTEWSNSGFAFDVSAHAFPKDVQPTAANVGKTVVVLHVNKAK